MRQIVAPQVAVAPELFAAIVPFAHVGLLVGVRAHVRLEVASLVENLLANVALMRRALLVDHLVHGQSARLAKALLAHRTLEGLLVRVDESVVAQVVLAPEGLVADITLVGPLVCVRALVDQQVVGLGELAPTEATDELWFGWAGSWVIGES